MRSICSSTVAEFKGEFPNGRYENQNCQNETRYGEEHRQA
jgi:hypothetical protein